MDEELLKKGFASVDSLDERIAQLRRLLAEEDAEGRDAPHSTDEPRQPGEALRISATSLSSIYETELAELLELRRHVAPSPPTPLLTRSQNFDSTAWLGWLLVAAIAGAVYYFLFR